MGDDIEQEQSAEEMRRAFEAFMLAGKKNVQPSSSSSATQSQPASQPGKKKKKKKKSTNDNNSNASKKTITTPPSSTPTKQSIDDTPDDAISVISNTPSSSRKNKSNQSIKKRYYQLLRSFADKVQHSWIDIDDQLLSVIGNIVSIRTRLRQEWSLLNSPLMLKKAELEPTTELGNPEDVEEGGNADWKYFGLQGKPKEDSYSFHLRSSDVRLALSHDLVQHEKMIAGIRSLMTNLADCHESLGRLVGNVWQFHLECQMEKDQGVDGEGDDGDDVLEGIVEGINDVFEMLSMELYRKQCLIPVVISSTEDGLLGSGAGKDSVEGSPLQTARKCCKAWPRSSGDSCVDEKKLSHVLQIGEM